jgi:tetratricopeptide (TPR) repeat protein
MKFWHRAFLCAGFAVAALASGGCEPSGQSAADDEKEPHFVLGQNLVNAMDYPGAIDAFEESLEANPHSAPAHFQLAWLYAERETNPAAAIYHYQQYLRFNPKAGNAEVVAQQIDTCKQQLAADVMPLPSSPAMQQQLQQLVDKNRQLQGEVDQLRAQLTAKTNQPPAQNNFSQSQPISQPAAPPISQPVISATQNPSSAKQRTHTVAAHETLAAIARKYGVSLNALLAANPNLHPKKLRVGQVINLPPP